MLGINFGCIAKQLQLASFRKKRRKKVIEYYMHVKFFHLWLQNTHNANTDVFGWFQILVLVIKSVQQCLHEMRSSSSQNSFYAHALCNDIFHYGEGETYLLNPWPSLYSEVSIFCVQICLTLKQILSHSIYTTDGWNSR